MCNWAFSGAIDQVFFKQKHLTPSYHSFQDNHSHLPNKQGDRVTLTLQGDHDNKQVWQGSDFEEAKKFEKITYSQIPNKRVLG